MIPRQRQTIMFCFYEKYMRLGELCKKKSDFFPWFCKPKIKEVSSWFLVRPNDILCMSQKVSGDSWEET